MQYKTVVPEEKETHEVIVLVVYLEARSRAHYGKSETEKTIVASLIMTIELWSQRSEFWSAGKAQRKMGLRPSAWTLLGFATSLTFEKLKPEYLQAFPEKMKLFLQFLKKRSWFAGVKLTFVDFLA
uniref:Glutathione S-transferase C-terminal domain-containing protein n=1 Tax=Myotis myotis TaxID=51298 RepID=A0A7J7VYU3_MYOMY|nr:hypothetical protein mMyoMyo1_012344 [Myotis myotis]